MTNQRLRPWVHKNKNVKIAKICDLRKFNPVKVKAYMYGIHDVARGREKSACIVSLQ